jgi:hypothetical protein
VTKLKIAFVISKVGDEKDIISKMSVYLAEELKQFCEVAIFKFKHRTLIDPFFIFKLRKFDVVVVANVGLQCAYVSLLKGFFNKKLAAISFGSDIRDFDNRWIQLFNRLSKKKVDLLIVMNPDLVDIALKRGYKNVVSIASWVGGLNE